MIRDFIGDFIHQLVLAAVEDHAMVTLINDGPPARYVVYDPGTGMTWAAFVPTGDTVKVNRSFRLIVEPIDHVVIRPLCVVHQRWKTV